MGAITGANFITDIGTFTALSVDDTETPQFTITDEVYYVPDNVQTAGQNKPFVNKKYIVLALSFPTKVISTLTQLVKKDRLTAASPATGIYDVNLDSGVAGYNATSINSPCFYVIQPKEGGRKLRGVHQSQLATLDQLKSIIGESPTVGEVRKYN